METLAKLAGSFADSIASVQTEVYNEFSLQHELGIFLRGKLPGYKVQFERNVSFFFPSKKQFTKKEIDISIFTPDRQDLAYAIELKYPRNGQYPEQMFSFCKDVAFAEEMSEAGFHIAGLVIFADDPLFYQGSKEGIYAYFRGGKPLSGRIQKPTGRKDDEVVLHGAYSVGWRPISGSFQFAVIEVVQ
jgi:hypothetical protein